MKILLVEDNERLIDRMKLQLRRHYLVDVASTGTDALTRLKNGEYTVIILDLGLPDMSGLDVCRKLRSMKIDTPVLILTGEDDMPTRVALLDSGADDYMTKPFDPSELRARIGALSRRPPSRSKNSFITHKDLKIDVEQRKVYRKGAYVPLRRKEFDILEYLVTNKGRVMTREMILNYAWDSSKISWGSTVDVHIKHLRDKIDKPFGSPLIKTAYGLGYRVDISE